MRKVTLLFDSAFFHDQGFEQPRGISAALEALSAVQRVCLTSRLLPPSDPFTSTPGTFYKFVVEGWAEGDEFLRAVKESSRAEARLRTWRSGSAHWVTMTIKFFVTGQVSKYECEVGYSMQSGGSTGVSSSSRWS